MTVVRAGRVEDLAAVNDVYNHYVRETHVTFDLEPVPLDQRRAWFEELDESGPHRVVVAADDTRVVGFASSHQFLPRQAYETSVTTSIYLAPDSVGQGVGRALYGALFDGLTGQDLHRAYAGIAIPNDASIALHERFGFRRVAYFTEQGRKFGRYWDVAWYEKEL